MPRRTWLLVSTLIASVSLLGCGLLGSGKLSEEEMRQTIEVEVRLTEQARQPSPTAAPVSTNTAVPPTVTPVPSSTAIPPTNTPTLPPEPTSTPTQSVAPDTVTEIKLYHVTADGSTSDNCRVGIMPILEGGGTDCEVYLTLEGQKPESGYFLWMHRLDNEKPEDEEREEGALDWYTIGWDSLKDTGIQYEHIHAFGFRLVVCGGCPDWIVSEIFVMFTLQDGKVIKVALYRDTYSDDLPQFKLPKFFDDDNAIDGAVTMWWHRDYWHYTE